MKPGRRYWERTDAEDGGNAVSDAVERGSSGVASWRFNVGHVVGWRKRSLKDIELDNFCLEVYKGVYEVVSGVLAGSKGYV